MLARMHHPNIVTYIESFEERGKLYICAIATEYIKLNRFSTHAHSSPTPLRAPRGMLKCAPMLIGLIGCLQSDVMPDSRLLTWA